MQSSKKLKSYNIKDGLVLSKEKHQRVFALFFLRRMTGALYRIVLLVPCRLVWEMVIVMLTSIYGHLPALKRTLSIPILPVYVPASKASNTI